MNRTMIALTCLDSPCYNQIMNKKSKSTRTKHGWGGKRAGAHRPQKFGTRLIQTSLGLTQDDRSFLDSLGAGSLSEAVHQLIARVRGKK